MPTLKIAAIQPPEIDQNLHIPHVDRSQSIPVSTLFRILKQIVSLEEQSVSACETDCFSFYVIVKQSEYLKVSSRLCPFS